MQKVLTDTILFCTRRWPLFEQSYPMKLDAALLQGSTKLASLPRWQCHPRHGQGQLLPHQVLQLIKARCGQLSRSQMVDAIDGQAQAQAWLGETLQIGETKELL